MPTTNTGLPDGVAPRRLFDIWTTSRPPHLDFTEAHWPGRDGHDYRVIPGTVAWYEVEPWHLERLDRESGFWVPVSVDGAPVTWASRADLDAWLVTNLAVTVLAG